MINTRNLAIFLLIGLFCNISYAQSVALNTKTAASSASTNQNFLSLAHVKEGMRGTARTVFRGTVPEEFSVEILGIVPGAIGPKQDMIVGKISGGQADRTAVFAGMSGSPVYIDGKLIGAISYSFPFAKEAICGITPIEQMIAIFEKDLQEKKTVQEIRTVSFAELASVDWNVTSPAEMTRSGVVSGMPTNSPLSSVAGQTFQRIATPVSFTGFSQQTLNIFAPQLIQAGLLPVASVGGSAAISPLKEATENTLKGGASVSMQLSRGDYSLAAAGTVTYRDGDKIYAFGHPFLSLGMSDLPMSESHVVTVIPNINNSFKLDVPDAMVGTMTQDRATGVFGKLGQAPKMIPVKIELETSLGKKEIVNLEVVRDNFLTPMLLNMAIYNTGVAHERTVGDTTVRVVASVDIDGIEPLHIDRRFTGGQSAQFASASVAMPFVTLFRSGFDDLKIKSVDVKLYTEDGSKTAVLDRMSIDRSEAKAGETIELQAFARTNTGRVVLQKIPVNIPADTPEGSLSIVLSDGTTMQKNAASQYFVPATLSDLISTMNNVKRPDLLYVKLMRTSKGAIIGSSEMPNLPPSVLATLNNERTTGGIKPAVQTIISENEIAPSEFLISGEQTLTINIVR